MQKEIPVPKSFVEEVIEERSLTMEDGRERGQIPQTQIIEKNPTKPTGPDDGDELG